MSFFFAAYSSSCFLTIFLDVCSAYRIVKITEEYELEEILQKKSISHTQNSFRPHQLFSIGNVNWMSTFAISVGVWVCAAMALARSVISMWLQNNKCTFKFTRRCWWCRWRWICKCADEIFKFFCYLFWVSLKFTEIHNCVITDGKKLKLSILLPQ